MEVLTSRSKVMVGNLLFYFCFWDQLQLHFLLLSNLQMFFYQGLLLSLDGENPGVVTLYFLMNERNLSSFVEMIFDFLLPGTDLSTSQFQEVFDNFLTIWN